MNYRIAKLDGRWNYHSFFAFAVIFSPNIPDPGERIGDKGMLLKFVLDFTTAQEYFLNTYGWSAEVRQWVDIYNYYKFKNGGPYFSPESEMPKCVNMYWSWTNGFNDLRIYVKSEKELTLFRLKYPIDQ